MDRSGVRQVPEGSGEQRKMKETGGCEVICGASTTLVVQGWEREGDPMPSALSLTDVKMMMMIMMIMMMIRV